jgi:uncharacterized protein YjiS (DUF1127 family)
MTTAIATAPGAGVLTAGAERALGTGKVGPRAAWDKYRAYRASIAELNALTDRQLADVGIARAAIRPHVRTAIYGN